MIPPKTRQSNIVVQEIENEVLIYDLVINKAFCLNQTSALVYELSDGSRTSSEISEEMTSKLNILVSEEIVWLALDQFKKDNLLENADELPTHFSGLTRREVIKRVGLSSMVMLPIVSSVMAPQSVQAASNPLGFFAVCLTSPQCISGNCQTVRDSPTRHCCVSTADIMAAAPGVLLFGCFSNQENCNERALNFCCNGQAGTIFDDGNCGSEFRCPCAATP